MVVGVCGHAADELSVRPNSSYVWFKNKKMALMKMLNSRLQSGSSQTDGWHHFTTWPLGEDITDCHNQSQQTLGRGHRSTTESGGRRITMENSHIRFDHLRSVCLQGPKMWVKAPKNILLLCSHCQIYSKPVFQNKKSKCIKHQEQSPLNFFL